MNCNKSLDGVFTNQNFLEEIENTKKCIIKSLNINKNDFIEITDETVLANLDNSGTKDYYRKIISFTQGTIDCYMALDKNFIYIFHHPLQ